MKNKINGICLASAALLLAFTPFNGHCLSDVTAVSTGTYNSYALLTNGQVKSWGDPLFGALGNGQKITAALTPVDVINSPGVPLTNVQALASGQYFGLALLSNGTVRGWGRNGSGQLADGSYIDRTTTVVMSGLSNVTAISAGGYHGLAISGGNVYCWGTSEFGESGFYNFDEHTNVPVQIAGISNAVAVSAGENFSLALLSDGTVRSWGVNIHGELGNGQSWGSTNVVQQVVNLSNVMAIAAGSAAGYGHSLALCSNGNVYAWGQGDVGQLGIGLDTNVMSVPTLVSDITYAVTNVVTTIETNLTLQTNPVCVGTVTFTNISTASLSNGVTVSTCLSNSFYYADVVVTNSCVEVTTVTNLTSTMQGHVTKIAAGYKHSLALTSDGRVWSWGINQNLTLGITNQTQGFHTNKPTAVLLGANMPLTGATSISTAPKGLHNLVILNDNTVMAWGRNDSGQLGNNSTTDSSAPVATGN